MMGGMTCDEGARPPATRQGNQVAAGEWADGDPGFLRKIEKLAENCDTIKHVEACQMALFLLGWLKGPARDILRRRYEEIEADVEREVQRAPFRGKRGP